MPTVSLLLYSLVVGVAVAGAVEPGALAARMPTAAAAPGRTCTASLRQPTPSGAICGQAGSLRNPKVQLAGQASTLEECRDGYVVVFTISHVSTNRSASCIFNNKQCFSFSYNAQNKRCITYTDTIKGSGFVRNAQSQTKFWHRVCWQKRCMTPEQPPPDTAGTGARAPCGDKICGQAYLASGSYTDQYLVECGNTYDIATAYEVRDAENFFDCRSARSILSTAKHEHI